MRVPRTYLRALITLDRTTIHYAKRITAGGDLPRLQDTDARQVTSAAQVEHEPGRACLWVPAVWNRDEARREQQIERPPDQRDGRAQS
jgi:hypothetical protein